MKTVTVETVRSRLSFLEGLNARGVGTAVPQQQFETACLRELLALLVCRSMPITVTLPKKNIGWDRDEGDCWNNAIDACAESLRAAGIQVIEGEGQ